MTSDERVTLTFCKKKDDHQDTKKSKPVSHNLFSKIGNFGRRIWDTTVKVGSEALKVGEAAVKVTGSVLDIVHDIATNRTHTAHNITKE